MTPEQLKAQFSSATDDWATPQKTFDELNAEFHFVLDVCASETNHKCPQYFDAQQDGLKHPWQETARCIAAVWKYLVAAVWMNPPYGRGIGAWVKKAFEESQKGCIVVCLLPARTDTAWWHDYVIAGKAEVRFVRGRLKFGGAKNSAPFPSAVVIFRPPEKN